MATVNKNFKIKSGLVVEGTTGTINGEDILTKSQADVDYIIDQVGGSGVSTNTPDTLVLRDGNGDFAAGTVTVNQLNVGTAGYIEDNDDVAIRANSGNDVRIYANSGGGDVRLYADSDMVLSSNDKIRLEGPNIYAGENLSYTDAERVATQGYVDDAIGNIDLTFNSDEITEGTTNLYYTDARVDSHLSGGNAITYSSGQISVDINENGGLTNPNDALSIDRTTVDTWYDASGAAADVATDLSTHETATTAIHGVTGNIVGDIDTQNLSNKTIDDALHFGYDNSNPSSIQGEVDGAGDLTVTAGSDLNLTATTGDIILNADGAAYIGSATAANEVATHSYVDNAVSGLSWKQAVNLRATSDLLLSADFVGAEIDGHPALTTADAGYRILIDGQDDATENGIYELVLDGSNLIAQRAADADPVSDLIGAAVFVMEGTQFGGTSWVQNDHYANSYDDLVWTQFSGSGSVTAGNGIVVDGLEVSIDTNVVATQSDLSTGLGGKQDTLTAGSNIDITSNTISVTGLSSTDISDFSTAALSATSSAYDASGAASTAESNANSYTDTALGSYTTTASLETTIDGYGFAYSSEIPGSTDSLTEGTSNLYYTDTRVDAEIADRLTNATLSNITITADGSNNLTITAENGVAGSTTDDLTEGETNLYFTNSRVVDAIYSSNIQPEKVDINFYRREEATQQYVGSISTVNVHAFSYPYESAKYIVRVVGSDGGTKHSQITEILMTVDGNNNIAITEYGNVHTSTAPLASFSASYNSGEYILTATTAVAGCEIIAAATMLSWAD